jgi:succinyl-diaminopimelate desuccinylase
VDGVSELAAVIDQEIEAGRDELVDLCAALVAAPSFNPPGRTSGVAAVVHSWLSERGVSAQVIAADEEAPNVVGRVEGAGPGRHVVFNAHTDTMESGDPASWSVPITELSRREGKLYGLGMGNMKGALAAMCFATVALHRHRATWGGRLSLAAVSDEVMFGERGTVFLLKNYPELAGDFMICGEGPGFMDLAVAEKGLLWLDVSVVGEGGHSSKALRGQTAVMKLAALLARCDEINEMYAAVPPELTGVSGGAGNLGLRVSLNAGNLAAGTVRSQVAVLARSEIDVRLPPGVTSEEIAARVRAFAEGDKDIRISVVKAWNSNWIGLEHPLTLAMVDAVERVRGVWPAYVVRLPGSDARHWRNLGVPSICYGPQPLLSAGIDDYAEERDVVDCAKVYARTALTMAQCCE